VSGEDSLEKTDFLLCGLGVLILGFAVYLAIENLSAALQLPILAVSVSVLILLSRKILSLERKFAHSSFGWQSELARFREEYK
jgi:drug/metabolite transporter (DMT)-like permease